MNTLKLTALGVSFLLSTTDPVGAETPHGTSVTPQSVQRMLAIYGPRGTVRRLTKNSGDMDLGDYERVLDGISKGDASWLALVARLKLGTDAATGETMVIAVAEALPINPSGVLRIIRAHPEWQKVCNYPMIEPSVREERRYFRRAIPAVRSVRDRDLQTVKKRCIADLVATQRH